MRRSQRLLRASIAMVVPVLLAAGCMSYTSSTSGSTVTFSGTGGVFNEVLESAAFTPLRESSGITVKDDSPNSEAKLKAMVESGSPTWDVYYSTPYRALSACGKYFEPIDYSIVDKRNLDPLQVSECGVPIVNSAFNLVYDKAAYPRAAPRSWQDFFDTRRFPGKRGVMNDAKDGALEIALLADGVPPGQLYPLDYDRAFAKLATIRSDIVFIDTGAQQQQALESGQVGMMLAWPSRAQVAKANGADLGVVWQQPLYYFDVLTVVKGSTRVAASMRLINQIVSARSQRELTQRLPYTPANSAADPRPAPLLREFMAQFNDNDTSVVRDNTWWARNHDEATERWTAWVNG